MKFCVHVRGFVRLWVISFVDRFRGNLVIKICRLLGFV